nr:unnamed protein product [Digitaria exilis]CAB3498873.1 unnamed protein product [Digitaria exilis]
MLCFNITSSFILVSIHLHRLRDHLVHPCPFAATHSLSLQFTQLPFHGGQLQNHLGHRHDCVWAAPSQLLQIEPLENTIDASWGIRHLRSLTTLVLLTSFNLQIFDASPLPGSYRLAVISPLVFLAGEVALVVSGFGRGDSPPRIPEDHRKAPCPSPSARKGSEVPSALAGRPLLTVVPSRPGIAGELRTQSRASPSPRSMIRVRPRAGGGGAGDGRPQILQFAEQGWPPATRGSWSGAAGRGPGSPRSQDWASRITAHTRKIGTARTKHDASNIPIRLEDEHEPIAIETYKCQLILVGNAVGLDPSRGFFMAAPAAARKRPALDDEAFPAKTHKKKRVLFSKRYSFVSIYDYEMVEEIGEGTYGVVAKAQNISTGAKVAIGEGIYCRWPGVNSLLRLTAADALKNRWFAEDGELAAEPPVTVQAVVEPLLPESQQSFGNGSPRRSAILPPRLLPIKAGTFYQKTHGFTSPPRRRHPAETRAPSLRHSVVVWKPTMVKARDITITHGSKGLEGAEATPTIVAHDQQAGFLSDYHLAATTFCGKFVKVALRLRKGRSTLVEVGKWLKETRLGGRS